MARSFLAPGRGRLPAVILLGILAAARIIDPPAVETLREASFELYRMLEGGVAPMPERNVVAVAIDEESLARHGQWPWPRNVLAELVETVAEGRPRATALNILLSEPGRLIPQGIAQDLDGLSQEARRVILEQPSADERLAAALAHASVVLAMAVTEDAAASANIDGLVPRDVVLAGAERLERLPSYLGLIRSLPLFTHASAGEGIANFSLGDGKVRKLPSILRVGEAAIPSLSVEILKVGLGAREIVLHSGLFGIESVSIGDLVLPTDRRGYLRVRFAERGASDSEISAGAVLAGEVPPQIFRDRYVIIGVTASGLAGSYPVSSAGTLSGLQLHAQLLEKLLASRTIMRPPWALSTELVLLLVSGLALIVFLPMLRPVWEVALLIGTLAVVGGIGAGGYLGGRLLIDVSWTLLACLAIYFLLASARLIAEERASRASPSGCGFSSRPSIRFLSPSWSARFPTPRYSTPTRLRARACALVGNPRVRSEA